MATRSSERGAVIEKIWPSIEQANRDCPAHARIARTHILFATPEKPMLRAAKGTIQRPGTLNLYERELEALYADADRLAAQGERDGPGRVDNQQQVSDFIQETLASITGWSAEQITTSSNFFHLGLDSLQTITATRSLRRGLDLPSFAPNLIYLHPSLADLTQATLQLMRNDQTSCETIREAQLKERSDLLEEFMTRIENQGEVLNEGRNGTHTNCSKSHTVLLTGSTGTLGTYILDALLKNQSVSYVHCLNRREDSLAIQRKKSGSFNLNNTFDSSRVTFWHANLSRKDLGLSPKSFHYLQNTATVIIHNAWNVNFNLSLSSFKPDLSGVINLINFTSSASKSPPLFFLSSISSVMGHQTESLIPETVVPTERPAPNGYANSKYIAEQLLDHAARTQSLRTSFARVGQIAGAARTPGLWNKSEWFPSLVMSSLQVGAIPDSVGPTLDRVDWVPIDLLAEVLVALALGKPSVSGSVEVFHPLNLNPISWEKMVPIVTDELTRGTGKSVETVQLSEWVQRVRQDIETARGTRKGVEDNTLQVSLERNPAAKLLDFFEGLTTANSDSHLDTQNTAKASRKLRDIDAVKEEWIRKWIGEWMEERA